MAANKRSRRDGTDGIGPRADDLDDESAALYCADEYSTKQSLRTFATHFNEPQLKRKTRPDPDRAAVERKLGRLKSWGKPH